MLDNGFAVGSSGVILRTTDGGLSWKDQESPSRANLYAVTAVSPNEAIAVGELGTVLVTSDGGRKWESQSDVTAKVLQAVVYRGRERCGSRAVAEPFSNVSSRSRPLLSLHRVCRLYSAAAARGLDRELR